MSWLRLHPAAVIIAALVCLPLFLGGEVPLQQAVERFLLAVALAEVGWRGVLRVIATYERINHPDEGDTDAVSL